VSQKTFPGVYLSHFASYVPDTVVDNSEIVRSMHLSIDGNVLRRAVGSKEKRAARKDEMCSDMMARVGLQILQETGVEPSSIDKLICSCDPQDQAAPDSSVMTQVKMDLGCPSFGVSMSCPAWICTILLGCGFLLNGEKRILALAASSGGSKYQFKNPMHRAIFGDGAGGALLERKEGPGNVLALDLWTDGRYHKEIFAAHTWSTVPNEIPAEYKKTFFMTPDNRVFYEAIDRHMRPFYTKQYEIAAIQPKDVSLFLIHQASMPLFNYTLKSLGIPEDKTVCLFEKFGNTVSAELPMLIDYSIRNGRIKRGDIVYLLTYGAGFAAGAMIFKY
jgi:3-oxoacyl-[acyl-carrier-protein] synthase III